MEKKTLATKIELRNSGIVDFEHHPEFIKLTNCKPDDEYYPSKEYCKNLDMGVIREKNQILIKNPNNVRLRLIKYAVRTAPDVIRKPECANQKINKVLQKDLPPINPQLLKNVVRMVCDATRKLEIVKPKYNILII